MQGKKGKGKKVGGKKQKKSPNGDVSPKAKKQKTTKDPDAPKKPNSYMMYSAMRRAAHTGETKLLAKELGVDYKALEGEEKEKFDEKFKEATVRDSSFQSS